MEHNEYLTYLYQIFIYFYTSILKIQNAFRILHEPLFFSNEYKKSLTVNVEKGTVLIQLLLSVKLLFNSKITRILTFVYEFLSEIEFLYISPWDINIK